MGRAQGLRAPSPLRKDAHNRTNATYRSRQQAVSPTFSNNTGVFYLTIVRCTIHTPTVQRITLRCTIYRTTAAPQRVFLCDSLATSDRQFRYSNHPIRCSTATQPMHTAANECLRSHFSGEILSASCEDLRKSCGTPTVGWLLTHYDAVAGHLSWGCFFLQWFEVTRASDPRFVGGLKLPRILFFQFAT